MSNANRRERGRDGLEEVPDLSERGRVKFQSFLLVNRDGLSSFSGVVDVDGEEIGGDVGREEVLKSQEVGDEDVNGSCREVREMRMTYEHPPLSCKRIPS